MPTHGCPPLPPLPVVQNANFYTTINNYKKSGYKDLDTCEDERESFFISYLYFPLPYSSLNTCINYCKSAFYYLGYCTPDTSITNWETFFKLGYCFTHLVFLHSFFLFQKLGHTDCDTIFANREFIF